MYTRNTKHTGSDDVICLSDALILSGFLGGGSGGSDAAIIVGPDVPFNCISSNYNYRSYVDLDLLTVEMEVRPHSVNQFAAALK